jgi:hypothetical protein
MEQNIEVKYYNPAFEYCTYRLAHQDRISSNCNSTASTRAELFIYVALKNYS